MTQGLDAGVLGMACADNGEPLTDGRASNVQAEGDLRASGASCETITAARSRVPCSAKFLPRKNTQDPKSATCKQGTWDLFDRLGWVG